jgi:outer membrane protein assembly factor BamB
MHTRPRFFLSLTLALLALLTAALVHADIVGWRGDGTGRFPTATPPTTWSKTQNLVWSTPLPGKSNSLPVIVGDKLFTCAEPFTLYCLNLADGKILWQKTNAYEDVLPADQLAQLKADQTAADPLRQQLATANDDLAKAKDAAVKSPNDADLKAAQTAAQQKVDGLNQQLQALSRWALPPTHDYNGYSSATPVSDGQNIWVTFGNGVAACYDLDGNRKWARFIEKPNHGWGVSSSPVLAGDRLLVNFLNCIALNPLTGDTLWTAKTGMYWGTPAVTKIAGAPVAFTPNGQIVRLSDGQILQDRLFRFTWGASPMAIGDTVYFFQIAPDAILAGQAFRLPDQAGDTLKLEGQWKGRNERYYGSPVFNDGLLYAADNLDELIVADAASGQIVYRQKLDLGGQVFGSVCCAGGFIYVTSDSGNIAVVKPGRTFEPVSINSLGDTVRSSPTFAGSRMYVRGYKAMYCIGQ